MRKAGLQPNIVNLGFNCLQTFLTEACRGGQRYKPRTSNATLPLIHYLLDNGADPREGCWACGALYAALAFSQSLEIIFKVIKEGGKVDRLASLCAMRMKCLDALELFFEKATFIGYPIDKILEDVGKSEDKEVMSD